MSDDFLEEFGPADGGQNNESPIKSALETGAEYGGAFARGALKQAAQAPGLSAIEPQGVLDWAKEVDPKHPKVEGAGRYVTPGAVALGGLPDLPMLAAASKGAPWLLRTGEQFAQNAWKGAVGGGAEGETNTKTAREAAKNVGSGAEEGMGTSLGLTAAQTGLRALPHWLVPAMIAGGELAHGHFLPWHIRHAVSAALLAMATRAAKIPAGVSGAAGEAAMRESGYEPGGNQPKDEASPF